MNTPRPDKSLPPELEKALSHEPHADQLARVWSLLGEVRPAKAPAADAERATDWDRLQTLLAPDLLSSPDPQVASRENRPLRAADRAPHRASGVRRQPAGFARWMVPALAAVVLAALAVVFVSRPVTISAAPGETLTAALPDGSTVEVNSGSTLTYSPGWRLPLLAAAERRVRLDGEAFFSVVAEDRPFIVETLDAEVRVLGTRFNVRARPETGTLITLSEGRVSVIPKDRPGEVVELEPGQSARVTGAAAPVQRQAVPVEQTLAWRAGGFAALNEPLGHILTELERRYDAVIRLEDRAAAGDSITVYFPTAPDLESIVRDLATARDLRYTRASRGYVLY
jgi:transmembrane sensor